MGEKAIRIGLIGFGTIGTGVVKLLQRNRTRHPRPRSASALDLVRIADIDTTRDRGVKLGRGVLVPRRARASSTIPTIDIVIELMGGTGTARRFVLEAITRHKDVVTANKALLAHHGAEIFRAAERAGVEIGFEASVGGGIPIIRTLQGRPVRRPQPGRLRHRQRHLELHPEPHERRRAASSRDVLKAAQADGLAEADPSFDVDGIDAAHKLTLLIQLAFGVRVPFDDDPGRGHPPRQPGRHRLRARVRLRDQVARRRQARRRRASRPRVRPTMVTAPPPARRRQRCAQRHRRAGRGARAQHVPRRRRRHDADRDRGGRRPDGAWPATACTAAAAASRRSATRCATRRARRLIAAGRPAQRVLSTLHGGRPARRAGAHRRHPRRERHLHRGGHPARARARARRAGGDPHARRARAGAAPRRARHRPAARRARARPTAIRIEESLSLTRRGNPRAGARRRVTRCVRRDRASGSVDTPVAARSSGARASSSPLDCRRRPPSPICTAGEPAGYSAAEPTAGAR